MRTLSICVVALVSIQMMQQTSVSCNKKFNPNVKEHTKVPHGIIIENTIKKRIKNFFRKIKVPTYTTSISGKVCPRRSSLLISRQVTQLKKSLTSSTHSKGFRTCSKIILWPFRKTASKKPFYPRPPQGIIPPMGVLPDKRRGRCVISTMTAEERRARDDLQPHGIRKNRICVRKEGACQEVGEKDTPRTPTIAMCRSCRFTVYIPESFFPNSFIHFQCGNGEDAKCLMSEGACKKRQLRHHIKAIGHRNNRNAALTITTGCACEILENSMFRTFVR